MLLVFFARSKIEVRAQFPFAPNFVRPKNRETDRTRYTGTLGTQARDGLHGGYQRQLVYNYYSKEKDLQPLQSFSVMTPDNLQNGTSVASHLEWITHGDNTVQFVAVITHDVMPSLLWQTVE